MGLDFYELFTSDVALFPCGIYMEIESLRLDLQLKWNTNKSTATTAKENHTNRKCVFIREEEKKRKKPRNRGRAMTWVACNLSWVALWPGSRDDLGLHGLVLLAAWVSISSSSLLFFSFLSFFVSAFWVINNNYFWLEIESLRLDFHVDATWKKCHIRREQPK